MAVSPPRPHPDLVPGSTQASHLHRLRPAPQPCPCPQPVGKGATAPRARDAPHTKAADSGALSLGPSVHEAASPPLLARGLGAGPPAWTRVTAACGDPQTHGPSSNWAVPHLCPRSLRGARCPSSFHRHSRFQTPVPFFFCPHARAVSSNSGSDIKQGSGASRFLPGKLGFAYVFLVELWGQQGTAHRLLF